MGKEKIYRRGYIGRDGEYVIEAEFLVAAYSLDSNTRVMTKVDEHTNI